jgi:flagellar protein FliL
MSDQKDAPAEAPKKSRKMLLILIAAVVLLGGGGGGAFVMLRSGKANAAKPAPVKGVVAPIAEALTINLAGGHYLKLNFALQETADAGAEAIDPSEAVNLAIEEYTGRSVAELSTEKGRGKAKEELLAKIEKAYGEDGKQVIMDVYYTTFVTQ